MIKASLEERSVQAVNSVDKSFRGIPVVGIDLDRTVIYSHRNISHGLLLSDTVRAVEIYQGKPLCYMTQKAYSDMELLMKYAFVVPLSTRTQVQFDRVRIPPTIKAGKRKTYAVINNGAEILINGVPDDGWKAKIDDQLASVSDISDISARLDTVAQEPWVLDYRVNEVFCFLKTDAVVPEGFIDAMHSMVADTGWDLSVQGQQLYFFPSFITKGSALSEVARICHADYIMAAGDGILDKTMLEVADLPYIPVDSILDQDGYMLPSLRKTQKDGIFGGEELGEMFLSQALHDAF